MNWIWSWSIYILTERLQYCAIDVFFVIIAISGVMRHKDFPENQRCNRKLFFSTLTLLEPVLHKHDLRESTAVAPAVWTQDRCMTGHCYKGHDSGFKIETGLSDSGLVWSWAQMKWKQRKQHHTYKTGLEKHTVKIMNTPRSTVCMHRHRVQACPFACVLLDTCPDLLQNYPVQLSTCSSSDLNSNREQWVETKSYSQLPCQVYLLSSPLAHFAGIHLPSCSSGIQSKISAGSGAKLSFSLAGLWKCQQRNHVNLTSSKSLHKLMYELEEWKFELLLMMNF